MRMDARFGGLAAIFPTILSSPALGACGDNNQGSGGSGAGGGGSGGSGGMPSTPDGSTADFVVLESTDLHTNILGYDYFKLVEDKSIGVERTSTLVNQARTEFPNN